MSKKRSFWTLLGVLVMIAMIASACAPAATEAPTEEAMETEEPEGMPFEGETVTIFTAAADEQAAAFQSEFVGFTEETGIEVVVEGSGDFEVLTTTRAEAGDLPDISAAKRIDTSTNRFSHPTLRNSR